MPLTRWITPSAAVPSASARVAGRIRASARICNAVLGFFCRPAVSVSADDAVRAATPVGHRPYDDRLLQPRRSCVFVEILLVADRRPAAVAAPAPARSAA